MCNIFNDNFQNFKRYNIPKAQLVIADIPYNLGNNAYASSPEWYNNGNLLNGESKKANKQFFNSDLNFNLTEFFHFCGRLVKPEPKETNKAGCMIVFCAFQQIYLLIEIAKKYGFKNSMPLFFIKKTSPQVLKANMRICGAMEYAVLFYRDKLPKFNNGGKMVLNYFAFDDSAKIPKIHPTQKPYKVIERLITLFTDEGDVVIDPCCGSGVSVLCADNLNRKGFGFEIDRNFYKASLDFYKNNREQVLFAI